MLTKNTFQEWAQFHPPLPEGIHFRRENWFQQWLVGEMDVLISTLGWWVYGSSSGNCGLDYLNLNPVQVFLA